MADFNLSNKMNSLLIDNNDQLQDRNTPNTSKNEVTTSELKDHHAQNPESPADDIRNPTMFQKKKRIAMNPKNRPKIPLQINLPKSQSALTSSGTYETSNIKIRANGIKQLFDFNKFDTSSGKIGQGASSIVLLGIYNDSDSEYNSKKFAIKVVDLTTMNSKVIDNEINTIVNLDSDYIVKLYDAYSKEGCIHIVLEYMEFKSLEYICSILPNKKIPIDVVREIAGQLIQGLAYLEEKCIIHRDIKPANCLMNKKGICKLGDFGFSKKKNNQKEYFNTYQGSFTYMSPERIKGEQHSFNADVWSLGLTILECAIGRYPFMSRDDNGDAINLWQAQYLIENGLHIDVNEVGSDLYDFVSNCTILDPEKRPFASQLLNHPFLIKNSTKATKKWIKNTYIPARKAKK